MKFNSLLFVSFLLISSYSWAIESGREPGFLEEVVVSARKVKENAQEIPVATTAFNAEDIVSLGIGKTTDLQAYVPGLTFSQFGVKNPSVFIRGIGQREYVVAMDPGVGVYLNGIYIPRTDAAFFDAIDVASMEVLKGPQGTLFGKNTIGGAILVESRKPVYGERDGNVSIDLGNYGRENARLAFTASYFGDISTRFALSTTNLDGYKKNVADGSRFGDEDRNAISAMTEIPVTDTDHIDMFMYWSKQDEKGTPYNCLFHNESANIPTLVYAGYEQDAFKQECLRSESLADEQKVTLNEQSTFKMTTGMVGLNYTREFDKVTFKSMTSWATQYDLEFNDDSDGTGVMAITNGLDVWESLIEANGVDGLDEERHQYSQEFQWTGVALDERLQYTFGMFFAKETITDNPSTQAIGPNTFAGQPIGDDLPLPIPLELLIGINKLIGTKSDFSSNTSAVYSNFVYEITPRWELSVGGRYTRERRERDAVMYEIDVPALQQRINNGPFSGDVAYSSLLSAFFDGVLYNSDSGGLIPAPTRTMDEAMDLLTEVGTADFVPPVFLSGEQEEKEQWSEFTPSLSVTRKWQAGEDKGIVYFAYSEGFKAGGFEPKGNELVGFDPERVSNYEIGLKADLLENTLRLSTSYYHMDYEDMQVRVAEQGERISDIFLYLTNAGEAKLTGFEARAQYLVDSSLSVTASFSKTRTRYEEFEVSDVDTSVLPPVQITVDRSGEDFASVPESTASLYFEKQWNGSVGTIDALLGFYYSDGMYIGIDVMSAAERDNYTDSYLLSNARVRWSPDRRNPVSFTLYVNNITDELYAAGGYGISSTGGVTLPVYGPPRMFGAQIDYQF